MPPAPNFDELQQEVRLAVVMYGGISLAIYMNGVTQEMLRLARATAPDSPGDARGKNALPFAELKGTERVYRKLGQLIGAGGKTRRVAEKYEDAGAEDGVNVASPIRTRFVIDVITGSSAGGINGIFLAKALANDQSIDRLKRLWVETGDFDKLLNNKRRDRAAKPQSLLDGAFMYRELLKALEGMEATTRADGATAAAGTKAGGTKAGAAGTSAAAPDDAPATTSPYVDELDLYVTTTDLVGLSLPLRLAGGVVNEPRHRNVFHFSYATARDGVAPRHQFVRAFNPFLAFAARCTSSFPVAFEPMRLKDIDAAVRDIYGDAPPLPFEELHSESDRWRDFYPDYLRRRAQTDGGNVGDPLEPATRDFAARAFADGGDLDNKPFGYAIDTLLRRRSDLPVDRKLVFVDPDPRGPLDDSCDARDVDVLQNTLFALAPSVSAETIREDIQRVNERNRLIERIRHFTDGVERDVRLKKANAKAKSAAEYAATYLDEMVKSYGAIYGGYHRVRVAALTDDLARTIARAANLTEDSGEFDAVRELVSAWRDQIYTDYYKPDEPEKMSQTRFLTDFDISFRLRRSDFLRARIDELSCVADGDALKSRLREIAGDVIFEEDVLNREDGTEFVRVTRVPVIPSAVLNRHDFGPVFRRALRHLRRRLAAAHAPLLAAQSEYGHRGKRNPLRGGKDKDGKSPARVDLLDPKSTKITQETLWELLKEKPGKDRAEKAREKLDEGASDALKHIAMRLAGEDFTKEFKQDDKVEPTGDFKVPIIRASRECAKLLRGKDADPPRSATGRHAVTEWARWILRRYYDDYQWYDQVIFPVTYETGVGETDEVEVVRVSPYDAKALIDEEDADKLERTGRRGRRKLGGTAFGHFGAFLKREWRTNDILWGRLDAAETLIRALLPGETKGITELRDLLIREALESILKEELLNESRSDSVRAEVIKLLVTANSAADEHEAIADVRKQLKLSQQRKLSKFDEGGVRAFFESCAKESKLFDYFRKDDGYEVDRSLDPQEMVQLMARSSRVFGGMLESLAEKRRLNDRPAAWVTRLAQVFWGFVEIAVPGSFANLLSRHLIHLLYAFEVFLVLVGLLFVDSTVQRLGLIAFGVTAAAQLLVKALGDFMRGRRYRFWRAVGTVFVLPLVALFFVSAYLGWRELADWLSWADNSVRRLPAVAPLYGLTPVVRWLALFGSAAALLALIAVTLDGTWIAARSLISWAAGKFRRGQGGA